MTKDAMAFLDGETVEEPVVEEAQAEPEQTEVETPQPVEAEPEGAEAKEQTGVEEPGSTPEPEPQNEGMSQAEIGLKFALTDEREKKREAQRELAEYQREKAETDRELRELRAQMQRLQQPKQEAPDWYENPQAAAQFQSQTIEQGFQARLMQQSKFFAEKEYGADAVNAAMAYFDQHPEQSTQFVNHPSPFHAAVEFHKRQVVASEIGSDPEAYRQKIRDEIKAELEAQYAQNGKAVSQSSKPKAPPPSMASAPATGGESLSPGSGFDMLFPD